jgi:tyrosine-protein kinase Etk/Wzc
MAGTGKSSFTMVLGRSIARAGKKVLMIDADIQKTTLSKWFDLLDRPGFMDSLTHRSIDRAHIFPTETSGLNIMPAGTRDDSSTAFEEIANGAFEYFVGQLSKQHDYDVILLDSSPILPVADATILASQVDGTIMVEREHLSQRTNVAAALARLGSSGGRLLGTVFVGSGGPEDYGYAYGYDHYRSNATS